MCSSYKEVPNEFVHRLFYPVVAMVITSAYKGEVAAMLASSCMPISLRPPMIGLAVMKGHRTYNVIKRSKQYAVCWVSLEKSDKVSKLAEKTPSGVKDKLAYVGVSATKGRKLQGLPVLEDAVAWLECSVVWSKKAGDHELFAAKVEAAYATEDFEGYWSYRSYSPMLYLGGRYATIAQRP